MFALPGSSPPSFSSSTSLLLPIFEFPHKNKKNTKKKIYKKKSEEIQKNNKSEKRMLEC
jgi:hypothetical protein